MARLLPRRVIEGAMATLPPLDQALLTRSEFQQGFIAMIREAFLAGPHGAHWDTALMISPWDLRPHDIRLAVYLWHG